MSHAGAPRRAARIALIAGLGLAIRLWLILLFPIIFGNDSMVRLLNRDRIFLSYQLPLLQIGIWSLSRISTDPLFIRLFIAVLGAVAGAAFYLFASDFVDEQSAFWAALLFATNPFVVAISTVPYQEILMLAGLLFCFHFFYCERWFAASICLGLACFTRFESWLACPVLMFGYAHRDFQPGRLLKAVLYFGWAPALWIVFRGGLSPEGSFVVDHSISLARLQRVPYLAWVTVRNTPIPTLILACAGLVLIIRQRTWRDRRLQLIGVFLLLFSVAILFSAHGVPPDPERYVTTREIHIPVVIVTLLAAFGFACNLRIALALGACGILFGFYGSFRFVQRETSRTEIRLGYELARYMDRNVKADEHVLVLAKPIDFDMYLNKVRETGGEEGVRATRKILATVETSPLDYQRTLLHSRRLGKDRLRPFPESPAQLNWIAVFSDFAPPDERSADLVKLAFDHPATVLRSGDRLVAIYHFD